MMKKILSALFSRSEERNQKPEPITIRTRKERLYTYISANAEKGMAWDEVGYVAEMMDRLRKFQKEYPSAAYVRCDGTLYHIASLAVLAYCRIKDRKIIASTIDGFVSHLVSLYTAHEEMGMMNKLKNEFVGCGLTVAFARLEEKVMDVRYFIRRDYTVEERLVVRSRLMDIVTYAFFAAVWSENEFAQEWKDIPDGTPISTYIETLRQDESRKEVYRE